MSSFTDPTEPAPPPRLDGLPPISPDFVEATWPDEIDNIVPTRGYQMTPMVGLGGSAGSIQALIEFFKAMPAESGMVFVVILHLLPTHESTMAELLSRSTAMKVVQAQDGQKVHPNHVYVIPPGKYLVAVDSHLKLVDIEIERGKRVAVDLFFRSLADTHGPHAAAVVLSGADGDGALGIKRIKERGGLTISQDPDQAEYSGMPRAAIETTMVDWVLEVAQIPGRLLSYFTADVRSCLPPEDGPPPAQRPISAADGEATLRDVLAFLRTRTGRDFSYYKRATILRRIARRLQVNGLDSLPAYLEHLRTHPGEAGALLQDLLISVTNFFRDRDAFDAIQQYIPDLFKDKNANDSVRVWVPACATGEEAYSMAMLLLEYARGIDGAPALQVFACDLNDDAIQIARAGHYPHVISADVSEDRLRRFFVKDHRGYRVRRELREMVLFASHDLLKDSPFSRMDLISCRNLLIYLNRDAQKRVLEMFHFALNRDGKLLLGSSEAVDDGSPLFHPIDKKHRIYQHQAAPRIGLPIPSGPSSLLRSLEEHERTHTVPVTHGKQFMQDAAIPFQGRLGSNLDRASLAGLHFKLIELYAPPSVIVNSEQEIVHLSEHANKFLKFPSGELTYNLLRVVDQSLRVELRAAFFRAGQSKASADTVATTVEIEGHIVEVRCRVTPADDIAAGYSLVVFESVDKSAGSDAAEMVPPAHSEPVIRHLERELEQVKSHLRDTVEQYESSTEELKASNEELQAMNEELRSATEELETGREELQSINEELTTVNQEMKGNMDELAHANSDLQNLMASTSIATVFLDRALAITRFTPSAVGIFNMIPGDIGRPLAHLKHRLEYGDLIPDAEKVLRTLVPIEREVRVDNGSFLARLQPYRTLEDQIAGVVLTLVNVTERNRAVEALRQSEERLRIIIESAKDYAIFTMDPERHVDSWNAGAETMFGYNEHEILGRLADILFTPEDRAKGDAEYEMHTARDEGYAGNERWHARKDGSTFYGSGSVMPLQDKSGALRGYLKIMRDLTENKRTEESLSAHLDELTRFNAVAVGRESRMIDLKKEVNRLSARLGEPAPYALDIDQLELLDK
ncbi:MAG: signal transduction histidine kinase with CheB and CheR [Planctomycetaceae bacterium]|nr:signal transduction histidine kinase with CheB and CheR [Planctomycetaceae bacterium]